MITSSHIIALQAVAHASGRLAHLPQFDKADGAKRQKLDALALTVTTLWKTITNLIYAPVVIWLSQNDCIPNFRNTHHPRLHLPTRKWMVANESRSLQAYTNNATSPTGSTNNASNIKTLQHQSQIIVNRRKKFTFSTRNISITTHYHETLHRKSSWKDVSQNNVQTNYVTINLSTIWTSTDNLLRLTITRNSSNGHPQRTPSKRDCVQPLTTR